MYLSATLQKIGADYYLISATILCKIRVLLFHTIGSYKISRIKGILKLNHHIRKAIIFYI